MSRTSPVPTVLRRFSLLRPGRSPWNLSHNIEPSLFSRRLIFVSEISFLGQYEIDWEIPYEELREKPVFRENSDQLQLLTKVSETKQTPRVEQDENTPRTTL